MKKTTKTTAIAALLALFFGLSACQEEVIPINDPSVTEAVEIQESIEGESEDENEDKGEDIRN